MGQVNIYISVDVVGSKKNVALLIQTYCAFKKKAMVSDTSLDRKKNEIVSLLEEPNKRKN
jgi:hypothetical protein